MPRWKSAWQTVYVLFFLELGTRRVRLAGCTANPTAAWVAQQARQLTWAIQDGALPVRYLIHDRDAKFPGAFDTVFASEGVTIIRTPYRAPRANAYAERWVRLILGERHLRRVLAAYAAHYNHARPRQGLGQRCPIPAEAEPPGGLVRRRDLLGGVLHEYYREAA